MTNPRKYKIWDATLLYDVLTDTEQIRLKIEEICAQANKTPDQVPPSLVPTELLYDMVCCLAHVHEKLEDEDLIKSGHPKTDKIKLH